MRNLIALPLLLAFVVLQTAILSRVRLFSGAADVMLVWLAAWSLQRQVDSSPHWALLAAGITGFVTHLPIVSIVIGYGTVVVIAKLFSQRVWQAPLLAMFGVCLLGTVSMHAATMAVLGLSGTVLPVGQSISLVTLPSVILNLLLGIPVFYWSRDLAAWVYPAAEAV